jgi:hypothetical protein
MRVLSNIALISLLFMLPACHTNNSWAKYSSNADGFTIYMPVGPKSMVKQQKTAFGTQQVHYIYWKPATFDINKLKLLQVAYNDCSRRGGADSAYTNQALDSSINLRKRDYTDLEVTDEHITLEGYPGRAFIYQDEKENSTTIVKTIMANNRIYTLTAVTKRDYPSNAEMNTFFDSFQILR